MGDLGKRLVIVGLCLAVATGCASADEPSSQDPIGSAAPTEGPATEPVEPLATPTPPVAEPAACDARTRVLVTSSVIDAGLGHRYLRLSFKNCTKKPLTLSGMPGFTVEDAFGVALTTKFEPWADRGPSSAAVDPGRTAYLGLEWLAMGRPDEPEAGYRFRVRVAGGESVLRDALDMADDTVVKVHPWTTRAKDVWQ